ncbi:hypothetical protein BSKO_11690 [Bryopsis sp. KO-2023]|nr:hypothetical protein BSKO_11690 [Bryopsis sp. KO-2023]
MVLSLSSFPRSSPYYVSHRSITGTRLKMSPPTRVVMNPVSRNLSQFEVKALHRSKSQVPAESKKRKRSKKKITRGPMVFTRGFLDRCCDESAIVLTTTVGDLPLESQIDQLEAKGCKESEVQISLNVSKISKGYFLRGDIETTLMLRCSRCFAGFMHPFSCRYQVWTNNKASTMEECVDMDELPFPASSNYLDTTQAVVDSIDGEVPSMCICGGPNCMKDVVVGPGGRPAWIAGGDQDSPAVNAFSGLDQLRKKLDK